MRPPGLARLSAALALIVIAAAGLAVSCSPTRITRRQSVDLRLAIRFPASSRKVWGAAPLRVNATSAIDTLQIEVYASGSGADQLLLRQVFGVSPAQTSLTSRI